MRILLAAKHAPHGSRPIGGVQSWCRTVMRELMRRKHEVITWGPEQPVPLGGFDLGIIANSGDTEQAFKWCAKSLNVCHGLIPAERPCDGVPVVYTSEEVRDHWGGDGKVIRQPIDTEFWSPMIRYGESLNLRIHLTRFSYRGGLEFVKAIAEDLQYPYQHVRNLTPEKAREVIRKSACVLATGRAALEAMACDVPVVIVDHRSAYQGPLMDLSVIGAMIRNYSGRGGVVPKIENLRSAIEESIQAGGKREHVLKHHDVQDVTDQLLEAA